MTSSAKDLLRETFKNPPQLTVPGRRYKEAHSAAVFALIEQIVEDHDRLEKHAENLTDTLKSVINHSQLAMSEMRRLSKGIVETATALKQLPNITQSVESDDNTLANGDGDEHDLKGQ
jgi:hypothetical protein